MERGSPATGCGHAIRRSRTGARPRIGLRSVEMRDRIPDHVDPAMLATFENRILGDRKQRIGKGPDRDRDQVRHAVIEERHGGSAHAAKPEGARAAIVLDITPFGKIADDLDPTFGPSRLRCKYATRSLLAVQAMTDRHTDGLTLATNPQLSAVACGKALSHRRERRSA